MNSPKFSRKATWCFLMVILCCGPCLMGCLRPQREVLYARATKLPEEVRGFMRLAQDRVQVNVVGTDGVGTFRCWERSREQKDVSAYLLVHEQDLAALIRAAKKSD